MYRYLIVFFTGNSQLLIRIFDNHVSNIRSIYVGKKVERFEYVDRKASFYIEIKICNVRNVDLK